jgi:hypothetical protein
MISGGYISYSVMEHGKNEKARKKNGLKNPMKRPIKNNRTQGERNPVP